MILGAGAAGFAAVIKASELTNRRASITMASDGLLGGTCVNSTVTKLNVKIYFAMNGLDIARKGKAKERTMPGAPPLAQFLDDLKKFGYRYCPCRAITGDRQRDARIICPCVYHKDEIKTMGHCLCGLFVKGE